MHDQRLIRWQDILKGECPRCGGKLSLKRTRGATWLNCTNDFCGFGISNDRLVDIFEDETHPIHRFTAPGEIERFRQIMRGIDP